MGFIDKIVAFFLEGGFWMYPILTVGTIGAAIAAERFIRLTLIERANKTMWNRLEPVLAEGDFDKARQMTTQNKSTVSRLLIAGLELQGIVRRREDIEIAMEEEMMGIIPQLEKRVPTIALFANISTLLGLLGTILGLIAAFNAVANANPAEKANLLSASISIAMNTTAFGLIVAIPLLLLHSFINTMSGTIVASLEMVSVRTLNVISRKSRRADQAIDFKGDKGEAQQGDATEDQPDGADAEASGDSAADDAGAEEQQDEVEAQDDSAETEDDAAETQEESAEEQQDPAAEQPGDDSAAEQDGDQEELAEKELVKE